MLRNDKCLFLWSLKNTEKCDNCQKNNHMRKKLYKQKSWILYLKVSLFCSWCSRIYRYNKILALFLGQLKAPFLEICYFARKMDEKNPNQTYLREYTTDPLSYFLI